MSRDLPFPFPDIDVSEDYNPAIRLFGKRFVIEQTLVEFLSEFLSIIFSAKKVNSSDIYDALPPIDLINKWKSEKLKYKAPISINLKLFSFLSSSRVDTRHDVHKSHYKTLINKIEKKIQINGGNKNNIIDYIEQCLRGFHGAGANRAWCAQAFYPVSSLLLTRETIWNVSKSKNVSTWDEIIANFKTYFSTNKRVFNARGGELLYLQLCNLFTKNDTDIKDYFSNTYLSDEEKNLSDLHGSLQEGFNKLYGNTIKPLDNLIEFIDSIDEDTSNINVNNDYISCEWCPRESWPEAFLYAVEINRILKANLDHIERLELLITGCVLQVLRSLCSQSSRYNPNHNKDNILGYRWIFSPRDNATKSQKLSSQRNLEKILALIQRSLRNEGLEKNASLATSKTKEKLYREADRRYGHRLFLSLGKKLGIISPYKGPGARLVMTDSLLRYLVISLIYPGGRCTYNEFLDRLYQHYGIAIAGQQLISALSWSGLPASEFSRNSSANPWLEDMLQAGGFLTKLSDACSIVYNDFR